MTPTRSKLPTQSPATRVLRAWLLLLAAISLGSFMLNLWRDVLAGGHSWKQGDWLINSSAGPIRRGLTGDLALWVADLLAISPLWPVIAVQVLLVAALYALILRFSRVVSGPLHVLLVLSPAFLMSFWLIDPLGSARKELLAFTSVLIFALGVLRPNLALTVLGAALFALSVAAHEAMVLFLPLIWALFAIAGGRARLPHAHLAALCGGTVLALAALGYAVLHREAADFMAVCQPLLDRGVAPHMCHGSIKWLEFDAAYGLAFVWEHTDPAGVLWFLLAYAVGLAPFFYAAWISTNRRLCLALTAAPLLLFLPLYPITADHGRWMSFHVFAAFVLILASAHRGQIQVARAPSLTGVVILFVTTQTLAPLHVREVYLGGVMRRILEEALALAQ